MPRRQKKCSCKQKLRRKPNQSLENCGKPFASKPDHCLTFTRKERHSRARLRRFQQRITSHLNLEESPLPAQCILSHPSLDESSLPVQCRGRSLFPRSGLVSRAVAPSMLQKRLIKPQTLLSYQCVSLRLMRIDPQIFSSDKQNTSIAAAAAFKLISRVVWKIYHHCCKLQATLSSIIWRLKC